MKEAKVTKINETTYRFTESIFGIDVYMYLLIGTEKALLIDTAYGFTDILSAIKSITDLPLIIVNTHGHIDHTHGNHFFEKVYLHEKDNEVFHVHNSEDGMKQLAKNLGIPFFLTNISVMKKLLNINESVHIPLIKEMCFELGERKVSVIETPGHTKGSVCLLDEKNQWLFSGDTTCRDGVLLHFPESDTVEAFAQSIMKIKKLVNEGKVKTLFPAHQETPTGFDVLDNLEKAATDILEGRISDKEMKKGRHSVNSTTVQFRKDNIK